jgi:4-hydroxy-tetrahydrodipicolinate synthase
MAQKKHELKGVLPVIQTPYRADWTMDGAVLKREIDWLFEEGVDGIVLAMVSEVLRLTDAERDDLTRLSVEITAGRGPVVASVCAESTAQAVRHTKAAEAAGADALMAIPPSLTRCSAQELADYYKAILEATTLPLVVQDASGYVGNSIPVATQAALLDLAPERVLFKPEAQPIGPNVSALLAATGGRAKIFEGTAGLALMDSFPRGIVGTMPGADVPWAIVAIWKALEAGDVKRAGDIHARLAALVNLMHNLDAYLAIEKLLLVEQGIFTNTLVRGPVGYHADEGTRNEVLRLFRALKEVCGK